MILIGLGANLASREGPPAETLRAALDAIAARMSIVTVSPFYRSPAWPDPTQPEFVNAVARVQTALSPKDLLAVLHATEAQFGRVHTVKNAPRTLDLDLLDYDGLVQAGPPELPHPRLADRAFVLLPLRDVAPGWRHPVGDRTLDALIAGLPADNRAAVVKLVG